MGTHILALDIGTQSARASLVTEDGTIRGIAQIAHHVDTPHPGWAQQRPDAWWEETCTAIRDVCAHTGVGNGSIGVIASCGQMHGPVGVDDHGAVTTEWVQLWCDKRCAPQAERLRQDHDEARCTMLAECKFKPVGVLSYQ